MRKPALLVLLTIIALPLAAATDPEIAALRIEIAKLSARLNALEAARIVAPDAVLSAQKAKPEAITASQSEEPQSTELAAGASAASSHEMGARIHFDSYSFARADAGLINGSEFRRARLSFEGIVSGWQYALDYELAGEGGNDGIRDAFIARSFGTQTWMLGQFKPFRSMSELTSSNDLVVLERPYSSGAGLFAERQWQQGLGWASDAAQHRIFLGLNTLRSANSPRNEGFGLTARAITAPWKTSEQAIHLGAWLSHEKAAEATPDFQVFANFAGRRGPRELVARAVPNSAFSALGFEAAWQSGGWLLQSEWVQAQLNPPMQPNRDFDSAYLQVSWLAEGMRAYDASAGVFEAPSGYDNGVLEFTARFDFLQDSAVSDQWQSAIFGLNYHLNSNLSWMFNYTLGESGISNRRVNQSALRTNFNF